MAELVRRKVRPPAAEAVLMVVNVAHDWQQAVDVIAQWPRPEWVQAICGDYPVDACAAEMLHPDDRTHAEDGPAW